MPKEVIGFYISKSHILCSETSLNKPFNDGKTILHFLANKFALSKGTLNVFWSLDFNVAALLSKLSLSVEQLQTLMTTTKLAIGDTYEITYITGKYFAVRCGKNWGDPYAMFSNADQYDTLYLPTEDSEDFAYQCACRAKQIGEEVRDALSLLNVTDSPTIISPINAFYKTYMGSGKKWQFPTVSDTDEIDPRIGEYAFASLDAGLFEATQKGHWDNVYDYDLNSAYSGAQSTLPDTRKGKWEHVTEFQDAPIGFYKSNVTITSNFSPIGFKTKDFNFTPTGTWERVLTQQQCEFIRKWNIGDFVVKDGFVWKPYEWDTIYAPLLNRLYDLKQSNTGITKNVIKRILTGNWGKSLEQQGEKFGEFFNPVVGSLVEINTRLKVVNACMYHNVMPISIALDGIVVDRPLENLNMGDGMGQWKLSHQGKCINCNAELCLIDGKDSQQTFTVTYNWVKDEVEKNPDASRYTMTRNSCVTIGKVIQNPKLLGSLGEIVPTSRSIDLGVEFKRVYPEHPQTGRELLSGKIYNSVAPDISMLEIMNLPEPDDNLLTGIDI
jgi:hypothetical protein